MNKVYHIFTKKTNFLDFLLSFEHSMSSPKNDSLSLKWILESKTALPYFIDYLTTINCDSFISFYINIDGKFFSTYCIYLLNWGNMHNFIRLETICTRANAKC